MNELEYYSLGIDIGSTTVKIAILDKNNDVVFSDYKRHYANIQETLASLLKEAKDKWRQKASLSKADGHRSRKSNPYSSCLL